MKKNSIDFSTLTPVTSGDLKVVHTGKSGSLGISIVNTAKNGKQVKLTKTLFESLGSPKELQFVTDGDYLFIGKTIPHSTVSIPFSSGKGENIIYRAPFVQYLTKRFELDFSKRTSFSFHDVEIESHEFEGEEIVYAKVRMSPEV